MINIGICDDDKRCRDILKQQIINTINEKEIYFTEFSNADSMIKRKDDLDVVFLDMELPDMDGETAARQALVIPNAAKSALASYYVVKTIQIIKIYSVFFISHTILKGLLYLIGRNNRPLPVI